MGKRGPPKTPSRTLKGRGTFRKDRHSDDLDAATPPELPEPPDHLTPQQKALWNKVGAQLVEAGILSKLDGMALELLITSYMGMVATAQQLADEDLVIFAGESGYPTPNPLVGINAKHVAALKWTLQQFGLTPAARTGIKLQQAQAEPDPMAALIAGTNP